MPEVRQMMKQGNSPINDLVSLLWLLMHFKNPMTVLLKISLFERNKIFRVVQANKNKTMQGIIEKIVHRIQRNEEEGGLRKNRRHSQLHHEIVQLPSLSLCVCSKRESLIDPAGSSSLVTASVTRRWSHKMKEWLLTSHAMGSGGSLGRKMSRLRRLPQGPRCPRPFRKAIWLYTKSFIQLCNNINKHMLSAWLYSLHTGGGKTPRHLP